MTDAHHYALDHDQCERFTAVFDDENTGVISKKEFVNFARFLMVISFLKTEDGQRTLEVATAIHEEVEATQAVSDLLDMLTKDRNAIHKIIPLLPPDVYDDLTSDLFITSCHEQFEQLDVDKSGTLCPAELHPVIVQLTSAHPYAIDMEHCEQFTAIFDVRGDGVIHADEFVDFARFLCVMEYLQGPAGQREMNEGLAVLESSKSIDELIETVQNDKHQMRKIMPYLPADLRDELLSDAFVTHCLQRFEELDSDGSGSLCPVEIYPLLLEMTDAHHYALDHDQCERFTAVFDDENTGVISKKEFVNFARFLMVISFLKTEDGQRTLEVATAIHEEVEATQAVSDLLDMLTKDRNAIHKIIPLLPPDVYDDLTSDLFITSCHEQFEQLDV